MRAPIERPAYTFKDSGITVTLGKLGPGTMQDLQRSIMKQWRASDDPAKREPKPPVFQTDVGPESNDADPEYQKKRYAWMVRVNEELSERLLDFAALYAVECTIDQAALDHLRATHVAMGFPLDEPEHLSQEQRDQLLYVTRICIATAEDITEFIQAVTGRSQPTQEAVQAHIDTFQGDVPGA